MASFDWFIYHTYLDILIERLPDGHPSFRVYRLFNKLA